MPRKPSASQPDTSGKAETTEDLSPAFDRLRKAAEALPGVEEGISYGTPALRVGKKLLCRVKNADTAVVMVDLEEKEILMAAAPDIYFETGHYKGWPCFLVHVHDIEPRELAHRLERAWQRLAPKKLLRMRGKPAAR
ncbi:MmcQ/YjbR family DNA-binding protein [Mesorhizobium sp. L-8-3]|uniref:MmcQ/YjbR family DNA-binding protein n=1 Tax=Mesorhizobium sp. L-8-3 TaxID=2744522 RepID=UPI0019291BB2|nr:MmcQ/YjbR family DNA-binding protein [Mesorhizobium sp. L-8-3]BCH20493.1 hypothetical protein MesoLjLb_02780 [Mesorhizobium sp. L-8-3]